MVATPKLRSQDLTSIELFAGAGGLAIGTARAGLKHLAVIERDADCYETLSRNQRDGFALVKNWPLIQSDVREVDFTQWQNNVDVICGGPPCQPFSIGGLHLGKNDKRDMFPEGVKAIRGSQPKAFIFENVRGLARPVFANYYLYTELQLRYPQVVRKKGEVPQDHFRRLQRIHSSNSGPDPVYQVTRHQANAADYGVPQRRQRIFIVGFRADLGIKWSFPTQTHSETALLRAKLSGDYWERNRVPKKHRFAEGAEGEYLLSGFDDGFRAWTTVREAIASLGTARSKNPTFANHTPQLGARIYPGHTGSRLDFPAKTLKAGAHGVPGGENMVILDNGNVRYFTVRESARLQTFPDSYVFPNSWTENMRQLGNAVPCDLAQIVVQSVVDAILTRTKELVAQN
jgi:DNA (cytosine-5)-methyltransferase 1